ncbi:MAG TPA: auxin efflux carrier family protein [Clostridiales bacterium UBA8960]|nr:auxin efflux carrier family protein [Clostridiales bacterium UBA8960]
MLENFVFSLNSALPLFFVMAVGYLIRRKNWIDDGFVKMANNIIFYVALPVKLFSDVFYTSFSDYFDIGFILFLIVATCLTVLIAVLFGQLVVKDKRLLSAFVQGAFRGNFLYIGLSLMENITGSIGAKAPLGIAIMVPLYNILAVLIFAFLNEKGEETTKPKFSKILMDIVKNPLIASVLLGIILSQFNFNLPIVIDRTFSYFAVVATPLALITIGASFKLGQLAQSLKMALYASVLKLVIFPLLVVLAAIQLGFSAEDVLLVYVLFGVPTATISYVFSVNMGGNGNLASSIIMVTTLLANLTMTGFIFAFKMMGMI